MATKISLRTEHQGDIYLKWLIDTKKQSLKGAAAVGVDYASHKGGPIIFEKGDNISRKVHSNLFFMFYCLTTHFLSVHCLKYDA